MKRTDLRPTIDDLRAAVLREYGSAASERVESRAKTIAWERLCEANQRATNAELDLAKTLTGPAWLAAQERISALFAEHARLMAAMDGGEVAS